MHAIRVLKEDHARIEALLEDLNASGGSPEIFARLERELTVHTVAEDNVFLPQVEEAIEDTGRTEGFDDNDAGAFSGAYGLIEASYANHRAVRDLLQQAPTPEQTGELLELVRRHIELEEELYPIAEKVLEEEDFERIGDLIEHCKRQVRGLAQARLATSSSFRPPKRSSPLLK